MRFAVYAAGEDGAEDEVFGDLELDAFPLSNTILTITRAEEVIETFVVGTHMECSQHRPSIAMAWAVCSIEPCAYRLHVSVLTRHARTR